MILNFLIYSVKVQTRQLFWGTLWKNSPQIAFAGAVVTLSAQESASGVKIRMSTAQRVRIFTPAFSRFLQA